MDKESFLRSDMDTYREKINIEDLNKQIEEDTKETNRLREEIDKWVKGQS